MVKFLFPEIKVWVKMVAKKYARIELQHFDDVIKISTFNPKNVWLAKLQTKQNFSLFQLFNGSIKFLWVTAET